MERRQFRFRIAKCHHGLESSSIFMSEEFDIIVAGGGISGCLAARRLHERFPDKRIVLIERDQIVGGRLRSTDLERRVWGYGLGSISQTLYEFIEKSWRSQPSDVDFDQFQCENRSTLGVLTAGKITSLEIKNSFSAHGARAIAGAAGERDWPGMEDLIDKVTSGKRADQLMSQGWKGTRKSPAAIATEHLARLYGIPDVWSINVKDFISKIDEFIKAEIMCDWTALSSALIQPALARDNLYLACDAAIAEASYENETWSLATTKGAFSAQALVVAQNPWDAIQWLDKDLWPSTLINVPIKTKPTSAVVLSVPLASDLDLPDVTIVAAEQVQVHKEATQLSFQATVSYEMTLVAPEVVKAIRRLKRARNKLLSMIDKDPEEAGEHIALQPVAWSQPLFQPERRTMQKLKGSKWQSKHLVFCGDAYGPDLQPENNLISSLVEACAKVEI